ncbi:MAG TPA: hypothetical protein VLC28_13835 [Flavitalea sp.]|nr:hypothetical protein [Flavitalea sp.]
MRSAWFRKSLVFCLLFFSAMVGMAENQSDEVPNVITAGPDWSNSSWIFTGIAALFLLVLVVVLRISTRRADV